MPQASILQSFTTERITVDDTVGGVRLTIANVVSTPPAQAATLTVESAQIRWTKDGTAPTSTTGHVANVGSVIFLDNAGDLWNFRAIRTGATSGTLQATYHR